MLILIGMCFSLMKALREETFESTLPGRVRRAVEHARALPGRAVSVSHGSVTDPGTA